MGIVRDITVEELTQAVGGIDTSGLAKDTTLQATNTALGNINTTLGGITTNDPPTDTTQQSIASAISALSAAVKPDASDIPYDSNLSVKGKIDEVNEARYQIKSYNTSIPVDNMYGNDYSGVYWIGKTNWSDMPSGSYGYLEVVGNLQKFYPYALNGRADVYIRMYINTTWNAWKRTSSLSDASITRQSGVSSNVPIPQITRRGNVVIIHFAQQFPAGTYYELYNVSPLPTGAQHAIVMIGDRQDLIAILSDGKLRFNKTQTISTTTYIIGQLVYLTDD